MSIKYIRFCAFVVMLLSACGQQPEVIETSGGLPISEPSITVVPTLSPIDGSLDAESGSSLAAGNLAENKSLPEDTATIPPSQSPIEQAQSFYVSAEGGFSVAVPEGYEVVEQGEGEVQIRLIGGDPDRDPTIYLLGSAAQPNRDGGVDAVYEQMTSLISDETISFGSPTAIKVAGVDARRGQLSGNENNIQYQGMVTLVADDERTFMAMATSEVEQWNGRGTVIHDTVLNSLIFLPVENSGGVVSSATSNAFANVPTITTTSNGTPGTACFGSSGQGLTCLLSDGAWKVFTSDNSALRSNFIADMDVCRDGQILIASSGGISVLQGDSLINLGNGWSTSGADGVACGETGEVWVAHFKGASRWDGTSWTTFGAELFSTGSEFSQLVEDVTIAPSGDVWIATANSIAKFNGTGWTYWQAAQGFNKKYFFERIFIDNRGRLTAVHSSGALVYEDDVWSTIEKSGELLTVQDAAVDNNGNFWLASYVDGLAVYDGAKWGALTTANSGLRVDGITSVAFDEGGRLWAGTVYGLHVFDGKEWSIYDMDSAEINANQFSSIAIVGRGPELPLPIDRANGTLIGSIMRDNVAYANARIEICPLAVFFNYYGATPCSDQPVLYEATTNADGTFAFTNIPVGNYILTIQIGATDWAQLTPDVGIGSELIFVPEGETVDVGSLVIGSAE